MKYFNDSDLFELFKFNYTDSTYCETLKMLLDRDGFNLIKTPTVDKHLKFLTDLQSKHQITGLSLNSNLYTKQERLNNDEDDVEILSEDL